MSHISESDVADARAGAQPPTSDPAVPASLARLRNAFGPSDGDDGGGGQRGAVRPGPASNNLTAAPAEPPAVLSDTAQLNVDSIRVDRSSATSAPDTSGVYRAREYFQVPPPSPSAHRDSRDDRQANTTTTAALLAPPPQSATHHVIHGGGSSSSSDEADYNDGEPAISAAAPHAPLVTPALPPPSHEQHDLALHRRSSSSSSSDVSPPRPPAHRLTAEEEQLARIRAYNEMSRTNANGARGADDRRGFLADTVTTLLPDGVTQWFAHSTDVVAQQSMGVVPAGVKQAANAIGNGAQHIGDVIEQVPNMMVNAIPTAIMSNEVKQLLFTDFSNTFRSFFHTNILSMPFVIRQAGLVGGVLLLTFVAVTSEYATEAYFGAKKQLKNADEVIVYGDVPRMVWGKWYPMLNIFYGVTHLIGFIAFSASNSVVLLGSMGMTGGGARALGLIVPSLIALPLVLMKNVHSQEPLSILSNLLVITAVVLMFIDFPYTVAAPLKLWPTSATEFFVALGVSVYAFTGIGSTLSVERAMSPRRYRRLLRASVALAYALLLAFGLSGFLSYGSRTCSVMTVSLQKGPLRTAVSALLFFASLMIIPQQTFPLCELSDRRLLGITRLTTYWDVKPNLMRIAYLIVSAFVAFIVPYYGLLLSISGALGCGIVGLVVPAGLDYVRRERKGLHHNRTMRFYEYLIVFSLGLYGCVVVVVGVVSGSYQLWISIQTASTDSC
ncbi:hypothetical protein ABB37_07104 [Leptomonas pyrrhocoris]|uniref:Amino acid transporter transmembrane domain-containing protein n=1 Tax=Leptomonas pyrrhocoris TaxID=157538 RepID=A0A0M9FW62_LEPPY|nr:hypothetical protein ABB37_07104 [Leptomonas pyrrhocoris]KPA77187.1 hypothetical protein ABB37_07104 [Leptomonas pyrrhocoris]|eukprot:XP_015655626.1 hypothetical protein ABB37_07104 [Leptomonas pyrrhocoris]